jgi:hypothetical protein
MYFKMLWRFAEIHQGNLCIHSPGGIFCITFLRSAGAFAASFVKRSAHNGPKYLWELTIFDMMEWSPMANGLTTWR